MNHINIIYFAQTCLFLHKTEEIVTLLACVNADVAQNILTKKSNKLRPLLKV